MNENKRYPFLLGTTSYIIPDNILPNARWLTPQVDDIELVLFESPEISNIPSPEEIKKLADLGLESDCGYTVHLPLDKKAGAVEENERAGFCDAAKRIIERTSPLLPRAWILHLEGNKRNAEVTEIEEWAGRCDQTITSIMSVIDTPAKIAIENLGYPWHWHRELALKHGTSLCCDVGHLWAHFPDEWHQHLKEMVPFTSVIHLHGFDGKKDHQSLPSGNTDDIYTFFQELKNGHYSGVVTMEIFNQTDFTESKKMVVDTWENLF
ncbi:cobamide remodeling phosphodiesterase CbiR [Chitinispirillales bacterium ANBcel5]|uniref:cobamide remodeling phosphodiesterase CbiR n=1 Tax=Cellulosispirillum alkaliphilum TaxID=3039283 RepID=UPI002A524CE3|nr:cobamide remodeling phosphodiesterase CbiR [Chitinispirillales bacterium ANBcel5]